MTSRKLLIVSGADRVGKSTLISELVNKLGDKAISFHHGAPPFDAQHVFDFYRFNLAKWAETEAEWCIFDRSHVCSWCLEERRRHNFGLKEDIVDFELELAESDFKVLHVPVYRPWQWSSLKHVEELKELYPDAPRWKIRNEYVARMTEHKLYYERLQDFYDHVTAFPVVNCSFGDNPEDDADMVIGYINTRHA